MNKIFSFYKIFFLLFLSCFESTPTNREKIEKNSKKNQNSEIDLETFMEQLRKLEKFSSLKNFEKDFENLKEKDEEKLLEKCPEILEILAKILPQKVNNDNYKKNIQSVTSLMDENETSLSEEQLEKIEKNLKNKKNIEIFLSKKNSGDEIEEKEKKIEIKNFKNQEKKPEEQISQDSEKGEKNKPEEPKDQENKPEEPKDQEKKPEEQISQDSEKGEKKPEEQIGQDPEKKEKKPEEQIGQDPEKGEKNKPEQPKEQENKTEKPKDQENKAEKPKDQENKDEKPKDQENKDENKSEDFKDNSEENKRKNEKTIVENAFKIINQNTSGKSSEKKREEIKKNLELIKKTNIENVNQEDAVNTIRSLISSLPKAEPKYNISYITEFIKFIKKKFPDLLKNTNILEDFKKDRTIPKSGPYSDISKMLTV